ncbi:MAG: hypothetical protein KKG04_03990 [Candidatus Thermoplasmatota archaeon]|nr:hypothetical protein [Candidatus Thermoplasmatota archaeon]
MCIHHIRTPLTISPVAKLRDLIHIHTTSDTFTYIITIVDEQNITASQL